MAKKRPSGGAQLKAAGKTGVLASFDAEQLAAIDAACEIEGRWTRHKFVSYYALAAARKIIENNSTKSVDTK